ncbi:hypothetical protein ANCCAN_21262 [Ancylostoma caninum]|uniref:Uncharacterized protein n=1 Tax=Ancylostoma caninum TaxID=29170 RepID=A0A368FL27_ANCCA|nr:hypothetical protein ANCCAN_21262 [Ancylostoma caninum]
MLRNKNSCRYRLWFADRKSIFLIYTAVWRNVTIR